MSRDYRSFDNRSSGPPRTMNGFSSQNNNYGNSYNRPPPRNNAINWFDV